MFTATTLSGNKSEQYAQLLEQARALMHGERDRIANAANLAALVYHALPGLNWVGFYFYDGEELVAMPALNLDVALVHLNRADPHGNACYLGPDPYFDDLFCLAAERRYVSCEQIVDTAALTKDMPVQSLLLNRMMVDGVVESPRGAHFTSCVPDYGRDEAFQRRYVEAAGDEARWPGFLEEFL